VRPTISAAAAAAVFVLWTHPALADCNDRPNNGVDWSGCDKKIIMLVEANLIGANLSEVNFTSTDLRRANLATATAMQAPTERHLLRRQQYFTFILQDILFHAYLRAREINRSAKIKTQTYSELFTVSVPDISRADNESLARSARDITTGIQTLAAQIEGHSETFVKQALRMFFRFSGEPQTEDEIAAMYAEGQSNADRSPTPPATGDPEEESTTRNG